MILNRLSKFSKCRYLFSTSSDGRSNKPGKKFVFASSNKNKTNQSENAEEKIEGIAFLSEKPKDLKTGAQEPRARKYKQDMQNTSSEATESNRQPKVFDFSTSEVISNR